MKKNGFLRRNFHSTSTEDGPPVLCGKATGSLFIARKDQRGATESSFKDRMHPYEK